MILTQLTFSTPFHFFVISYDKMTGYRTKSILCIPIVEKDSGSSRLIGIFQFINKLEGSFTKDDEILMTRFSDYCSDKLIIEDDSRNTSAFTASGEKKNENSNTSPSSSTTIIEKKKTSVNVKSFTKLLGLK